MAGQQIEVAASRFEKGDRGMLALSLTNYDNDSEPQIAAGSIVEIGDAIFQFTAAESITGWGSIGNNNDVYIKLVVSGTAVTASFTTVAPTWSTSKQGWYDGLDRYVAKLYKDASGNYTLKRMLRDPRVARILVAEELTDEVVKTAKIEDLAVTTAKLDNAAVTAAKIANGAVNKDKLGPWTSGSSGTLGAGATWGTVEGLLVGVVTAGTIELDFGASSCIVNTGGLIVAVEGTVIKDSGGGGGAFYMVRLWS